MADDSFKDYVLDQLSSLDQIECEPMFGGHGIYHDGFFFGIIYTGELYFKTDEGTKRDYVAKDMQTFSPNGKVTLRDYYQVPVDILEESESLVEWAKASINVQRS